MRSTEYVTAENLRDKSREWLGALRDRTAPRPQLQLDPDRAALLVIDMLEYFAAPTGRCFLPASAAVVEPISALPTDPAGYEAP